jgi:hypothetical protein
LISKHPDNDNITYHHYQMLQVQQRSGRYYLVCETSIELDECQTPIQMNGDVILRCPKNDKKQLSKPLERVVEDHGWIDAFQSMEMMEVDVSKKKKIEHILIGVMYSSSIHDKETTDFWLDSRTLTMLKKLCNGINIIYYCVPTNDIHYDKENEKILPIKTFYMMHNEYAEDKKNRVAYTTRNNPGVYVTFDTWQSLEDILGRLAVNEVYENDDEEPDIDEELMDMLEEQPYQFGDELPELVPSE